MIETETSWTMVIIWLCAGVAGAVLTYIFMGPMLAGPLDGKPKDLKEYIAKYAPPYFAVLVLILGVDLAVGSIALSRGMIYLEKGILLVATLITIMKLIGRIRKGALDLRFGENKK